MGFYSGKDGQLYLDGSSTAAAKVESWSLSATQATLDTTSLGDTDRTLIAGMRSASGSCSIAYYSDASGSNEATTLLNKIIKARTSSSVATATFQLGFKDYQNNVKHITVEGVITSAAISSSQGEILKADISFEVNGAPTGVAI